jgi:hypothetical protein
MTKPSSTILADIRAAKRAIFEANREGIAKNPCRFYWKLVPRERELQEQAVAAFGKLNGWRKSSGFGLDQLAGHKPSNYLEYPCRGIFDHALFYKIRGRPAAIVGQPYPGKRFACISAAMDIADRLGLALHIPRMTMASVHLPGGCAFLVFCRRDHQIKWLPEQFRGVPGYAEQGMSWVRIVGSPYVEGESP